MSSFKKKEQNLNELIDRLNTLSLSYSQPTYELEKIRTEKKEIAYQKTKIEKKNQELMREHKYLKEKIKKLQLEVNKKYADLWPNISEKKDPPSDHEQFKDVENKYEKYFKENLE